MIKEAIGVAPTIEEARKMAIDNLHAPIDADVKVEVVTFLVFLVVLMLRLKHHMMMV